MFSGLYTALITPFDEEGALDEEGLAANIRFQIENEVDGILVLGTTGEAPTLTQSEKERIIAIARKETQGKLPLMVGTGTNCTQTTIEQTLHAQKMGADCAVVIAPYYNKPTQEGLFRHFHSLIKAVDIPIILYNHPGRTGINVELETLQRLDVAGLKEASEDISQISETLEKLSLSVFSGNDALTLPILALGGHGVISIASNLIPREMKQLLNDSEMHHRLAPLFRALNIEINPIPIKTAMNLCGMAAGPCRLPLCEMAQETSLNLKKAVEQCLKETHLLPS